MSNSSRSGAFDRSNVLTFIAVLAIASAIVTVISRFTNHIIPAWDLLYYIDMARNGVRGNDHLVAPFAYRFATPLLVGAVARNLHLDAETAFDVCGFTTCIIFAVCCFYFARYCRSSRAAAAMIMAILCCYYFTVKNQLFSGASIDIYALPLMLAAFWLLMRRQYGLCLLFSSAGLFFKEFLLVPLATQAIMYFHANYRANRRRAEAWVGLTFLALMVTFLLPRLLIHVTQTFQDIDPLNDLATLKRLIRYPLSWHHDFNIVFSYLAFFLPALVLATPHRSILVWREMKQYGWLIPVYLFVHFWLVMYGGWNIPVFVVYSFPVLIIALAALWRLGNIRLWEDVLILPSVIIFNRLWTFHAQPNAGTDQFIDYYGGFYFHVSRRSVERMFEVVLWVALFAAIRYVANLRNRPRDLASKPAVIAAAPGES